MIPKTTFRVMAGSVALLASTPGIAATTVDAFDNGWYLNNNGSISHITSNTNTITGFVSPTFEYRSFYAFDLTGLSNISSASITFFGANGTFRSDDGSETVALYDFNSSISNLLNGFGDATVFNDLGTGSILGQATVFGSFGTLMPEITISLSSDFISQFNSVVGSADQRLVIGAALTSYDPNNGEQRIWGSSNDLPAARLNFTQAQSGVPEPSTWIMLLLGFGFIGGVMRSRNRVNRLQVTYS